MNVDLNPRTAAAPSATPAPTKRPMRPNIKAEPVPFKTRLAGLAWPLAVAFGLALLWQGVVALEVVNPIVFPSPIGVAREILFVGGNLVTGGYMLPEYWTTLQEVAIGFVLAAVVGFSLGTLVGVTEVGRRGVMPLLVSLNTMPKVAFAPVFIAWFGFGMLPKIAMAMIVALFPVIVNTAAGLMAPSSHEMKLFRQIGASKWQLLKKLQLPSALPSIFAGLRTASVFAVIGAVIGEFLGGGSGFGELIRVGADMLRIDRVFGLIAWLSAIGLTLYSLVSIAERKIVFWRPSAAKMAASAGN